MSLYFRVPNFKRVLTAGIDYKITIVSRFFENVCSTYTNGYIELQ